ncbi:conserved hypothetical protein [Streptomyces pristinaespiralis ATCC 25486]|uniref:Uncharacterized protein n=3 Tax=Streptomyces TaxID=1883 RepID=B5HAY7_STRE2|nr:hypothetical protein [Streptomyces pristinaespiralis]ALC18349.1 acetyltransferase [Streptomyces pristinaespiralis]ALC25616.1 acetyltransferase [Streptomyces pristinaespiralis]EDY63998.1 conserved hypothetical protein [Streptomyces pristinaespiralis ATCC 25486]
MLNPKGGSRVIVLPLVPDVPVYGIGTADQPFPAVVGIEEPFDSAHAEIPKELRERKERIEAFTQQKRTAVAAVNSGVPLEEVARWAEMPTEVLRRMLTAGKQETCGGTGITGS